MPYPIVIKRSTLAQHESTEAGAVQPGQQAEWGEADDAKQFRDSVGSIAGHCRLAERRLDSL